MKIRIETIVPIALYFLFGILTTMTNVLIYHITFYQLQLSNSVSTIIAWLIAVVFAYLTNRKWVFRSKSKDKWLEFQKFISCRFSTGVIDLVIMIIFVDIFFINPIKVKIFSNILVIALNYITSKFIIFKSG